MQVVKERDEFEKICRGEREQKDQLLRKAETADKRCIEAQVELQNHRKKTYMYDEELARLKRKVYELEEDKVERTESRKAEIGRLQRRLEQVSYEKEVMGRALQEY